MDTARTLTDDEIDDTDVDESGDEPSWLILNCAGDHCGHQKLFSDKMHSRLTHPEHAADRLKYPYVFIRIGGNEGCRYAGRPICRSCFDEMRRGNW